MSDYEKAKMLFMSGEAVDTEKGSGSMENGRRDQAGGGGWYSYQRKGTDPVSSYDEKARIALEVLADMKSLCGEPESLFILSPDDQTGRRGIGRKHIVYLGRGSFARRDLYESYAKQILDILTRFFPELFDVSNSTAAADTEAAWQTMAEAEGDTGEGQLPGQEEEEDAREGQPPEPEDWEDIREGRLPGQEEGKDIREGQSPEPEKGGDGAGTGEAGGRKEEENQSNKTMRQKKEKRKEHRKKEKKEREYFENMREEYKKEEVHKYIHKVYRNEYLLSLRMMPVVKPFEEADIPRVAQLTTKVNQFNLTTKRYTQAEVEAIAAVI